MQQVATPPGDAHLGIPGALGEEVLDIAQQVLAYVAVQHHRLDAAARARIHLAPLVGPGIDAIQQGVIDIAAIGALQHVLQQVFQIAAIGEQDVDPQGLDHHQVDGNLALDPHDAAFVPEHVKPGRRTEQQTRQAIDAGILGIAADLLDHGEKAALAAERQFIEPVDQRVEQVVAIVDDRRHDDEALDIAPDQIRQFSRPGNHQPDESQQQAA